jgi:UDP-N-acetylmuramate-alanine ligase
MANVCFTSPSRVSELSEGDFLLVNADDPRGFSHLAGCKAQIVTYGMNSKACITASSIGDDSMQICIQRVLPSTSGREILPQEFAVALPQGTDPMAALAATAAKIIS